MSSTKPVAAALIGLAALIGQFSPASAQDIIVTRTDDPVPDGCTVSDCSLREAVIAANVDPASYNDIRLSAATYQVNTSPLEVAGGTRFQGVGNTQTLIRGDGNTDVMTFSTRQQLDLINLGIDAMGKRELLATNENRVSLYRIRAPNPLGTIEAREPEVAEGIGGSFSVGESEIRATIVCVDKRRCDTFDSSIARLSVYGTGGIFGANGTDVAMTDVIVDGTLAASEPSGVSLSTSGLVRWGNVVVQDTSEGVDIGPNLFSGTGELEIDRLRYVGNVRPMEIRSMAGEIARSEFLDNTNSDVDEPAPGALNIREYAEILVDGSTFISNYGASSAGGAILINGVDAALNVRNSTFSGNSISVAAAALPGGARGGAIGWNEDASDFSLILRHITVSAPTTLPNGLSGSAIGGFGDDADGTVRVYNSIVRGSCSFATGSVDFGIGNIESSGNSCGFPSASNQVSVSGSALALGALGDHGGRTLTIVPGTTSVARDEASLANCADYDQRGYVRPQGPGCDVGAVETDDVIFAEGYD